MCVFVRNGCLQYETPVCTARLHSLDTPYTDNSRKQRGNFWSNTAAFNLKMVHTGVYTLSHTPLDADKGVAVGSTQVGSSLHYDKSTDGAHYNDVHLTVPKSDITKPYRGMGKEELLRFSSRPFWRRLRMVCISIILLGWLAMIFAVVALVLIYPKCRAPETRDWWQSSAMYRVYVRSFQDSDGDGIGDLKGLQSRLDYMEELGVGVVSLSPVYRTGTVDDDFDIVDHKEIDPEYGNLTDFKSLVDAAHDRGLYIIMDFIPNHTSDKHPWFSASSQSANRSNDKRNYYVWSGTVSPPNNWVNVYDESAWTYDSNRKECYFHQLRSQQPDLNIRSALVQKELEDILKFWLDLGVDGFYIRDSGFMFEDFDMRNEEHDSESSSTDTTAYEYYDHKYTYGLPEVFDMFARWRTVLAQYSNSTEKILMGDSIGGVTHTMDYYGHFGRDGIQIPINKFLFAQSGSCDGTCVRNYVHTWMSNLPKGKWANWMMGDENSDRFSSRFPANFTRPMFMLTTLLPGTPIIYYGDEINVEDIPVSSSTRWAREQKSRGLMQWENSTWGGFQNGDSCPETGCGTTWIGIGDDYQTNNVKVQESTGGSLLEFFKELMTLRKLPSFQIGEFHPALKDSSVFSFVREFDGEKGYLVAINFSPEQQKRNFQGHQKSILELADVALTSGQSGRYKVGDEISTDGVILDGFEGVVLSWSYQVKEL
ncbi:hypothetical protein ScPMuIL_012026 [Solemya velum]